MHNSTKRIKFLFKKSFFSFLFLFLASFIFGQEVEMVSYKFTDKNLNPEPGAVGSPVLLRSSWGVGYSNNYGNPKSSLYTSYDREYIELQISTEGYKNIKVEWEGGFWYGNSDKRHDWILQANSGTGFSNYYTQNCPYRSWDNVVDELPSDFDDNSSVKIRLRARVSKDRYVYLDNLKIKGTLISNKVSLSTTANSINESGGNAIITASLVGIQEFDVTVNLALSGTSSPSDYSLSNSQIVIPAGSLSASVNLSSVNDVDIEGDESVNVSISSVVGGVEDGNQMVMVTIIDDDFPSTDSIEVDDKSPESGYTPDELVQNVLITGCLTASNVSFSGDQNLGVGYFNAGTSDFPLSSGVILSTGRVENAEGPDSAGNGDDIIGGASGDSDAAYLSGNSANDVQILEFDFVPAGDKLEFRYIFASEEYPNYACTGYNDVFAFIISGPGIAADSGLSGKNIALIPGTADPVTINNVNDKGCGSSAYYVDERNGYATRFNGRTTVLTAKADVTACETYHIRLIISDVADVRFNSAVFLEAKSFKTNEIVIENGIGVTGGDLDVMYEGCEGSFLKFTREDNLDEAYTFEITLSGTAENGVDFVQTNASGAELGAFPEQITIPANETEAIYYYKAISDALIERDEHFRISFLNSCPCSSTPEYYTKDVTIIDVPEIHATVPSNVQCMSGTPVANLTVEMKDGLDPANYEYSLDGGSYQDDNVFTIDNPVVGSEHTISVQDKFSCNSPTNFTVTIPEVVPVQANAGNDKSICEGQTVQLSGSGGIYYEWSCSPASGLSYLSNVNASNPTVAADIPFGVYTYTLTVKESSSSTASCISTDAMVLTVKENSHFSIATDKTEYCSGEQVQLSSNVVNGNSGDIYLWTSDSEITNTALPNTTASYNTAMLAVKDFSLKITKANGCSHTETVSGIIIYPHPVISLNALSNQCTNNNDGELRIDVSGGTPLGSAPFYNYSWSHNAGLNSPNATGLSVGNYSITVTDSKNCTETKSYLINRNPSPVGIFQE